MIITNMECYSRLYLLDMSQFQQHAGRTNEDLTISSLFSMDGIVAVVTGGGTGIGLMITQALIANGAKVYITGRREDALNKVVEQYSKKGSPNAGEIIAIPCDITNKDNVQALAADIKKRENGHGINLLVNNAGITSQEDDVRYADNGEPNKENVEELAVHLWQATTEQWQLTLLTNLTSQYFTSVAFTKQLAQGTAKRPGYSSSIVNITSINGFMVTSAGGQFSYSAAKAGLNHLTRTLAHELKGVKVRVNAIAPGVFPSEMTGGDSNENQKTTLKGMGESTPAQRAGDDRDMAATILYLASPGCQYINGQILTVDGGLSLTVPLMM